MFKQDEIIEMAIQSGAFEYYEINLWADGDENPLIFFAKLVEERTAAKTWAEGYKQGVEDERISEANIGIAGFGMKVDPARENPYIIRSRGSNE